jgi:hypothetical protein
VEEEKEEGREVRPRGSRSPRSPEPPEGGAGPAGNVCFHYFPCLTDDALPPTSSSSLPASHSAALHRRAPLRPLATEVRTLLLPSCGRHGHRAEAERPPLRAATLPLVMPAIEPGWDAIFCRCRRLHRRARHLPSFPSSLFGRRACCSRP